MRLSLRLILLLATGVTLLTLVVTWADVRTERLALSERLQQEAQNAADRLQQAVEPLLRRGAASQVVETLERFGAREHLAGAALRDGKPVPFAATPMGAQALTERPDAVRPCSESGPSLVRAGPTAEEEAGLGEANDSLWTPERLRVGVHNRLGGSRLFLVSNREPYEHVHRGRGIGVQVPASGLVTALEPILRACDGTWIAHGSGDADREVVDERSRLRVPPEQPRYSLRRVWLTREEEEGYYFGFANEGLWHLCDIAYTRPMFRTRDWEHYRHVNQTFADAVLDEMDGVENPLLLIQDYHFACLPALVKERRPDAPIALFWHIPGPTPEAFGI